MTAKEELKQLLSSLTREETQIAVKVFQDYFLKRQEAPQPQSQKAG